MGALTGIRVIDFGQYIPGPLAAVMLADQGADVIHVDPPGGPRWQDSSDAFFNRSKRRIVLDLKLPEDRDVAQRLIESADVVIENFRTGVMDRLGLGAEEMMERNPGLIYTSIPGFASDDPRRDVPGWEGVVAAATDIYHPASELYVPTDPILDGLDPSRPTYTPIPLASNFAAFHAAASSVMALIARNRSGRGQHIEVPMFDAVFELIGVQGISTDGVYPVQSGSPYGGGRYLCGDGRWVQFSTSNSHFLTYFAKGAGIEEWNDEGLLDPDRLEREPELRQRLRARFRDLFLTRPAQEWEEISNAAGCPMTMVRSAAEWMQNAHARSWGTVAPLVDPELGTAWMPGLGIHLTDSPGNSSPRSLPDADHADIVAELDRLPPRAAMLEREPVVRLPLEGFRVLDLTQVVAGPCAGRIMAEYGAEVIKINSPFARNVPGEFSTSGIEADPGNQQHEHLNRGKLTLRLDIRRPEGREVFWKLVQEADIVMQNFPNGTVERYGIGYDEARKRKPDIIYFSLSAYGYDGPWGAWRGYEGNAQAATGLMERFGGDGPPMSQPFLLDDYGTGVRGAFGMALALYHRQQTSRGQHVMTALVETATYHAARFLVDYKGKESDEPRGPMALGEGPLQRLYKGNDQWFFLGAAPEQRAQLASVEGLDGIENLDDAALEHALEQRFALAPARTWLDRLRAASIGASTLGRVKDLMLDPWAKAHNLSVTQDIEGVGRMTMPGVAPRLLGTPLRVGDPVRPPGADGPMLLNRVGVEEDLDRLVEAGVIRLPTTPES